MSEIGVISQEYKITVNLFKTLNESIMLLKKYHYQFKSAENITQYCSVKRKVGVNTARLSPKIPKYVGWVEGRSPKVERSAKPNKYNEMLGFPKPQPNLQNLLTEQYWGGYPEAPCVFYQNGIAIKNPAK